MNSPDASPTPAAMTPGPMMRHVEEGASGSGRTSGAGNRLLVGNRLVTEVFTSSCCLAMMVIPSQEKEILGQDRTALVTPARDGETAASGRPPPVPVAAV